MALSFLPLIVKQQVASSVIRSLFGEAKNDAMKCYFQIEAHFDVLEDLVTCVITCKDKGVGWP